MPIKAIIFDFDGLIIDTETPDYDSWNQIFADYDTHLSLDEWLPFVGQAVGTGNFIHTLSSRSVLGIGDTVARCRKLISASNSPYLRFKRVNFFLLNAHIHSIDSPKGPIPTPSNRPLP